MNNQFVSPCQQWAEKLALLHSDDLSSADRAALEAHLASCDVCTMVGEAYQTLDRCLHQALLREPALQVSSDLLRLENVAIQGAMTASFAPGMGGKKKKSGGISLWRASLLLKVAVLCLALLLVGVGFWGRSLWENTLHPVPHSLGLLEKPMIDGYRSVLGVYTGSIKGSRCGSLDFTLSIERQRRGEVTGTFRWMSKNPIHGTVVGGIDTSGRILRLVFIDSSGNVLLTFSEGLNGRSLSSNTMWGAFLATFRGSQDVQETELCPLSAGPGDQSGAWIMHPYGQQSGN